MRACRLPFKQLLAISVFIAIFSGHPAVFAETAGTADKAVHHEQESLDWPGIYYGFVPCPDCNGVKTTLALNKNNSYILITQNVGKSPREFVEKGKFTWGGQSDTIVLTPRNSSTVRQYIVGENTLIQLDNDGNRISGELADRYVLRRTDITKAPPAAHSSH
ncbi:MAG: copper resistance protein NlpE [Methylovulum sp.]|nr:copper resistance protein NlpE [Methylovulum sp.]